MPTAAQLIGRIRLEGVNQYVKSLLTAQGAQMRLSRAADVLNRSLLSITAGPLLALAGAAGAGSLIELGANAIHAAADFEQMRVTLEALTGSAETAAEKIAFMRQLAIPSTFTFTQLMEAGTQLEAFGLRIEKVLPLIAKLGGAFKADQIHLNELIRIFGEAQTGVLNARQLASFGLSRHELSLFGVEFDPHNKLLSSTKEVLDGLERLIEYRYGNILDKMANTTNAKLATLTDRWQESLRKIGFALIKTLTPMLERFTAFIDRLNTEGGLDRFLSHLGENLLKIVVVIGKVLTFILFAVAAIQLATRDFVGAFVTGLAAVGVMLGTRALVANLAPLFKAGQMGQSSAQAGLVPQDLHPELGWTGNDALNLQSEIAANTAETAHNTAKMLDLRKYALGGGPLGEIGVTPVERYSRGGRQMNINVNTGNKGLDQWLADMFGQYYLEMKRQGL